MPLNKIRLELARTKDHPQGDPEHYHVFIAPLTADGHLDLDLWHKHKQDCTVVSKESASDDERHGHLVHDRSGWHFVHLDAGDDQDDEPMFKLDRHHIVVGEYVSLTESDDVLRTFRIASINPVRR